MTQLYVTQLYVRPRFLLSMFQILPPPNHTKEYMERKGKRNYHFIYRIKDFTLRVQLRGKNKDNELINFD